MKHPIGLSSAVSLLALLAVDPALADGGRGGPTLAFPIQIEYDEDETSETATVQPLPGDRFRVETEEEPQPDYMTLLREGWPLADGASRADQTSYMGRVRLNFDTAFTGEDIFRVRLQSDAPADDANSGGISAADLRQIPAFTTVSFGRQRIPTSFETEPRFFLSSGFRWNLQLGLSHDQVTDDSILATRYVPGDIVRYDTPTFAGFTLSNEWGTDSPRQVPEQPVQGSADDASDHDRAGERFWTLDGAYGSLTLGADTLPANAGASDGGFFRQGGAYGYGLYADYGRNGGSAEGNEGAQGNAKVSNSDAETPSIDPDRLDEFRRAIPGKYLKPEYQGGEVQMPVLRLAPSSFAPQAGADTGRSTLAELEIEKAGSALTINFHF